jgi:hypothetical protein
MKRAAQLLKTIITRERQEYERNIDKKTIFANNNLKHDRLYLCLSFSYSVAGCPN